MTSKEAGNRAPGENARLVLHLLPNAHLDPVWLWDWREGLNEAEATVSTVLDLMDEFSSLTFNRGEALIYRHLQKSRPDLFQRILKRVAEGRWDVVGGTYVQPDANLSATETLCRQFEEGLSYFEGELGVRPRVAWQPDSFGHPGGWPQILEAFGMEGFLFTRPLRPLFPMEEAAFWWNPVRQDTRMLCYRPHWRSYCNNRDNLGGVLDMSREEGLRHPLRHVAALMGLGNHGGGPTRRHIHDAARWAANHPGVEVRFSTLHGFFRCLRSEPSVRLPGGIPAVREEFGYCLRGCYSTVQKFKAEFRHAEAELVMAESTKSFLSPVTGACSGEFDDTWRRFLFNSFHDILPGSSIERAMEEQARETAGLRHAVSVSLFHTLNALARRINTCVPKPKDPDAPAETPFLVWNPLPVPFRGQVEIEASLDYRPYFDRAGEQVSFAVRNSAGRRLPFQEIATEHHCMPEIPWRKRALVPVNLPPFGWRILRLGLDTTAAQVRPLRVNSRRSISNGAWEVSAARGLAVRRKGRAFFAPGRLRVLRVEDSWGSWGGMKEESAAWQLDHVLEEWPISEVRVLESGPERAVLWTRWQGTNSWLDLTFLISRGDRCLTVRGRMLWNERSARLQLVIPARGEAVCDVAGGTAVRRARGQVPVGRWFCRVNDNGQRIGVATDVLGDADFLPRETRLTLARASRYGDDVRMAGTEDRWRPASDCGELKFELRFFSRGISPDQVVREMLHPPVVLPVAASPGDLPSHGSAGSLEPRSVILLSAQMLSDQALQLRVQNRGSRSARPVLHFDGKRHALGVLRAGQIRTFSLAADRPVQTKFSHEL
jgi:alpha-mannosidase